MAKADNRRAEILDRLADYVLAEGLSASSLRPLAKAAGISDRMLLYYFTDKADVIEAVLEVISARMVAILGAETSAKPLPLNELRLKFGKIALSDEMWPYMRLWIEIAGAAAQGDTFYKAIGERMGRGFLLWGASQLACESEEQREIDAAKLLTVVDGAALLKSVGMADIGKKAL